MTFKKTVLLLMMFIIMAATLWYLQGSRAEAESPQQVEPEQASPRKVSAEAFVLPEQEIQISFEASGQLLELLVAEGDMVEAGQPLARLDNTDQKFAVAEAMADLEAAQARLNQLLAGPTPEQVAQKEVLVAQAEAALETLLSGATAETIAEARAQLQLRQSELEKVRAGTRSEAVQAAEAAMHKAAAEVQKAQHEYNKVRGHANFEVEQPRAIALQKATLAYEQARANYQKLAAGTTPEEIAVAQAKVGEEQAALAQVQAGPTEAEIAAQLAAVQQQEADLALLLAGSKEEAIAVGQAEVAEAEAKLAQAELALQDTELFAPFAGLVADLPREEGEFVSMGQAVLTLAQFTRWHLETDDLTELDVVHVSEGLPVEINPDALPNDTFAGVVRFIKPQSEMKAGDVTYMVEIEFTDDGATDERLRWGMTTFVDILVGQ